MTVVSELINENNEDKVYPGIREIKNPAVENQSRLISYGGI